MTKSRHVGRGKGGGRPKVRLTDEQRMVVESMAAVGAPAEMIGAEIGIATSTLKRAAAKEIKAGRERALVRIKHSLFARGLGDTGAAVAWLKIIGEWREGAAVMTREEVAKAVVGPLYEMVGEVLRRRIGDAVRQLRSGLNGSSDSPAARAALEVLAEAMSPASIEGFRVQLAEAASEAVQKAPWRG